MVVSEELKQSHNSCVSYVLSISLDERAVSAAAEMESETDSEIAK